MYIGWMGFLVVIGPISLVFQWNLCGYKLECTQNGISVERGRKKAGAIRERKHIIQSQVKVKVEGGKRVVMSLYGGDVEVWWSVFWG